MTIPWLMNCGHRPDGWCMVCVRLLGEQAQARLEAITEEQEAHRKTKDMLRAEREAKSPEVERVLPLIEELRSMPRYDCQGAEGDYNAGMEPGEGYVDYWEMLKILQRYEPQRGAE